MTTLRVSGTIGRPVEDVWNILSNPENAPVWSRNMIEEKLTSPLPVRVGSTRRALTRAPGGGTTENHAVCTDFEPNQRIAWRSTSGVLPFHVVVDFAPVSGGTRIDSVWIVRLPVLLRLASPILAPYLRRVMERDLAYLKALMEAGRL